MIIPTNYDDFIDLSLAVILILIMILGMFSVIYGAYRLTLYVLNI
jgi:hypothetical protein